MRVVSAVKESKICDDLPLKASGAASTTQRYQLHDHPETTQCE
jgi:hypothetical protein